MWPSMRLTGVVSISVLILVVTLWAQSPPAGVIPPDYFGMHVGDPLLWPTTDTLGRPMTFDYLGKGTRVGWGYIQCSAGGPGSTPPAPNWSRLDAIVTLAHDHGVKYLATLGGTPCWAAPAGSSCTTHYGCSFLNGSPNHEQDWINFVIEMTQRYEKLYPGTVDYELYNEPEHGFAGFPSSPNAVSQLVTMTNDADTIIRANAPDAVIASPSFTTAAGINEYYQAGGTTDIDVVSHHFEPGSCLAEKLYGSLYLRGIQAAYNNNGLSSKTKWDTESNWGGSGCSDITRQAEFTIRDYLLQWSLGVTQVHWYEWTSGPVGVYGTMYDGTTIYPDSTAYMTVQNWMVGAVMPSACTYSGTLYRNAIFNCLLTRPGNYQALAVWNTAGNSSYRVPNPYTQYRDWQNVIHSSPIGSTVTIGPMPILLETPPSR
jgi:polysaccharide biosynthesis protein PslG